MLSQADALARELAGEGSGANSSGRGNSSGGTSDVNSAAAEAVEDAAALRRMEQMQGIVRAVLSCIRRLAELVGSKLRHLRNVSACCGLMLVSGSSPAVAERRRCRGVLLSSNFRSSVLSSPHYSFFCIYYLGTYETHSVK